MIQIHPITGRLDVDGLLLFDVKLLLLLFDNKDLQVLQLLLLLLLDLISLLDLHLVTSSRPNMVYPTL